PLSKGIKRRGTSIKAPDFKLPIVISEIPHQANELFDSKLNNKSIFRSLFSSFSQVKFFVFFFLLSMPCNAVQSFFNSLFNVFPGKSVESHVTITGVA
ncbi:GSCOCG00000088001-RA-CDS, partial [Cotesia congregata]